MVRLTLGALPYISFLVWAAALYLLQMRRDAPSAGIRNALLQSAALLGLWVVLGTEGLSAVNQLKFVSILIWWLVALIAAGVCAYRNFEAVRGQIDLGDFLRFPTLGELAVGLPFITVLLLALTSAVC